MTCPMNMILDYDSKFGIIPLNNMMKFDGHIYQWSMSLETFGMPAEKVRRKNREEISDLKFSIMVDEVHDENQNRSS